MRVETDRSRNGYRVYSDRKYEERFPRKNYRHNDHHHYYSSRHHHHNEDYSLKRIANSPSPSYYTDASRYDRPTTNREIYSSSLDDQTILNDNPPPPPPTDLYHIRDRDSSTNYNDSDRNRYYQYPSPSSKPSSRRENSSYRSSMNSSNELYRTSDYQTRSERYDISQNRNCSIAASTSPVYYQTSSSYTTRDEYPSMREVDYRTRDYGLPTIDHHPTTSNSFSNHYRSYRDHSDVKRLRSNFRPLRR